MKTTEIVIIRSKTLYPRSRRSAASNPYLSSSIPTKSYPSTTTPETKRRYLNTEDHRRSKSVSYPGTPTWEGSVRTGRCRDVAPDPSQYNRPRAESYERVRPRDSISCRSIASSDRSDRSDELTLGYDALSLSKVVILTIWPQQFASRRGVG